MQNGGINEPDMILIQKYIKINHKEMYKKWSNYSEKGYYRKR